MSGNKRCGLFSPSDILDSPIMIHGRHRGRRRSRNAATQGLAGSGLAMIAWIVIFTKMTTSMRMPRPWSGKSACEMSADPDWPFAYSKYREQEVQCLMVVLCSQAAASKECRRIVCYRRFQEVVV